MLQNPGFEPRLQYFLNQRRWANAMILPGKIIMSPGPACFMFAERRVLSRQAKKLLGLSGANYSHTDGFGMEIVPCFMKPNFTLTESAIGGTV